MDAEKKRIQELEVENNKLKQKILKKEYALEEVLSHIEVEKEKIKSNIQSNIQKHVIPIIQKMRLHCDKDTIKYLKLLEKNLCKASQAVFKEPKKIYEQLTPKEQQICYMVKNGLSAKEIANFYKLSPRTVDKHRENIRKKLSLDHKRINLATYLSAKEG